MENGSTQTAVVEETEAATKVKGTVTKDPETTALVRIFAQLDALDTVARTRVLTYLFDKYGR